MDNALIALLDPVLADLHRSDVGVTFQLEDATRSGRFARAMLRATDGSGTGIQVDLDDTSGEQLAQLASAVQDVVIEDFLLAPWPRCPVHVAAGHPLLATVVGRAAMWTCPSGRGAVAAVGALFGDQRSRSSW